MILDLEHFRETDEVKEFDEVVLLKGIPFTLKEIQSDPELYVILLSSMAKIGHHI